MDIKLTFLIYLFTPDISIRIKRIEFSGAGIEEIQVTFPATVSSIQIIFNSYLKIPTNLLPEKFPHLLFKNENEKLIIIN